MVRRSFAVVVLSIALVAGGCGGRDEAPVTAARVPDGLVPPKVQNDTLAFYESALPGVRDAFANAGPESLAADGRLWELRRDDRLVGALQLATLMPEVDLEDEGRRREILSQIMPTSVDSFDVDEVKVWTSRSLDKNIYLWFGRDLFAVLSLKGTEEDLDAEGILTEVVTFSASSDNWRPLYIDDEDEDEDG